MLVFVPTEAGPLPIICQLESPADRIEGMDTRHDSHRRSQEIILLMKMNQCTLGVHTCSTYMSELSKLRVYTEAP